jgi:hypothetical protein
MKAATCPILVALLACPGCGSRAPAGPVTELSPDMLRRKAGRTLHGGIAAYNAGDVFGARRAMEEVLAETKDTELAFIRAAGHFYLAAVAWDLGEEEGTRLHLDRCRRADPGYEPDWTFISPGLRRRFESAQ